MTDARTTKLEWIRDALKWVVGISSGLLTLSATYFYDRFDQAPSYRGVLLVAWGLLIVSALAGILATTATWKNLDGTGSFGPYLSTCYTISMWTFMVGFVALAFVLVVGRADQRELGSQARARHATNLELAQRRAERVGALLADSTVCKAPAIAHVIPLTSGWRHDLPAGASPANASALLADDRRVEVYGFEVKAPARR